MADPIFTIILAHTVGGAASGAAKHLSENMLSSGQKWLTSRFKDHQPKAIEKAEVNASHFWNNLALKVQQLEENQQVDRSIIDRALEEPSFGALLQSALIGAAQTESPEKHDLLASIVASRLNAGTESVFAAASQMAASAVAHCSPAQLRILGFCASLTLRWHGLENALLETKEALINYCRPWFETRFAPYADLTVRPLDLIHLEAVSCLAFSRISTLALNDALAANWAAGIWALTADDIMTYRVGDSINRLWNEGGTQIQLTSIGSLIGILSSDRLCAAGATQFSTDWTS